jgi:AcrR family transcriptional regulator
MPRAIDVNVRRAEIASAVRAVLERDGVDGVTMRNVAREFGSTTGLLTHAVPNRMALIHLALCVTVEEQIARADEVLRRHPTDIVGAIEEFLPIDAQRQAEMKIWLGFWAFAISDEGLHCEQRDRYRELRRRLAEQLRQLGVDRSDAVRASDHLIATTDGIAVAALFDPSHWTPGRQRRHLKEAVSLFVPLVQLN